MALVNKKCNIGGVTCDVWIVEVESDKFMYGAHGIAQFLGYTKPRNAILQHVKPAWRKNWEAIMSALNQGSYVAPVQLPANWHPHTVFISEAGVCALIMRSKLPAAEEFQRWLFEEVLPELRKTGKYCIEHKPTSVANYDKKLAEAQIKCLQLELKLNQADMKLTQADTTIAQIKQNYERQILEFKEREFRLQMEMKDLTVKANMTMMQYGISTLLARDNIKQNEEMRDCMSLASDRLVPSIANQPEKEHYVTCYDRTVNGRKRIRVKRSQFGDVQQCDKMAKKFRQNPDKSTNSKRYGWLKDSEKYLQIKCPNPVTLWVKIRNLYPCLCYGFRFVNSSKTEVEVLNEEELREKYREDVIMCEHNLKKDAEDIARFESYRFESERDAVNRCLSSSVEAKDKLGKIIQNLIDETQAELTPKKPHISFENADKVYTPEQVVGCIRNSFNSYIFNFMPTPLVTSPIENKQPCDNTK
ncbi:BRO-A [Betabaculovirus altermyunipunctae]|uniref:BRO-A n=1 Tax=Betabaculovirus altermyunipunctae TaxID=3051996 RepID=A0A1S5YEC3_9BBAC|nr:BRO-A [Betabaculovirus altermyunipunctae]AQQ80288.1 BRO-A [Betabaculovirus altermyunipunctae]